MTRHTKRQKTINLLQEFSVPLIAGVFAALYFANSDATQYHHLTHSPLHHLVGHSPTAGSHAPGGGWFDFLTLHFLVNDLFMALFFGIAAKEITEACLPGGALNPVSKAINPLFATVGGVLGPIGVFLLLNSLMGSAAWSSGWGIPTATDIALAWLAARLVFGNGHPAISFLLLLAVADDGIGLAIIAIAYPNPDHPTLWANALWILPGMAAAYGLRRAGVRSWIPYIAGGGAFSWYGLYSAHLHPALALVFIVPFLPGPRRDLGLFLEAADDNAAPPSSAGQWARHLHSPLEQFEHQLKLPVDLGLFFFAFVNAGVALSGFSDLTWIILVSLIVGKTLGITTCSLLGQRLGFDLPAGMRLKHLVVVGVIAGLGLTVALFVSGQAFTDAALQGAAKMGALLSACALFIAIALGWVLNVRDVPRSRGITWPAWKWSEKGLVRAAE
ncbi:MAG: Na+/H+ antiporter NhaA [Pirellulales bacterium]